MENKNDPSFSFLSELESFFYSYSYLNSNYLNNRFLCEEPFYYCGPQYSWNNYINSCIDSYIKYGGNSYASASEGVFGSEFEHSLDNAFGNVSENNLENDLEEETSNYFGSFFVNPLGEGIYNNFGNYLLYDLATALGQDFYKTCENSLENPSLKNALEDSMENALQNDLENYPENDLEIDPENFSENDLEIDPENDLEIDLEISDLLNDLAGESLEGESLEGGSSNDLGGTRKYGHLWVVCENCYTLNYKKYFLEKMYICEGCGSHVPMHSSDRIELLIDPGTWEPMYEGIFSLDPIEFHSEEDPYQDRIDSYQRETGLTEAVQTGIGRLNGIPVAMGVMDFRFIGGSMGSVVGERITRLIEHAANQNLPLILVCASGGARMQEGSLSLMQMAKISSALYDYQLNKKLFYISILTSPTTGGVTASFGMLGDIVIAEPNAYIAFAGKRVIEETLNIIVPEGVQETEYLFEKGSFDLIVPRKLLKSVLSELFELHAYVSFESKAKQNQVEH